MIGFADLAFDDATSELQKTILPSRHDTVVVGWRVPRPANPQSLFAQREALLRHRAKKRRAEPTVTKVQRLRVPIRVSSILDHQGQ